MKRSEMLDIMFDALNKSNPTQHEVGPEDMKHMLDVMENSGMRPPSRELSWDEIATTESGVRQWNNSWEPENI